MVEERAAVNGPATEQAAKLARLREAKAARDQAVEAQKQAREIELLELEERFERELGQKGRAWGIVEVPESPIVLKTPELVTFKRYQAANEGDKTAGVEEQAMYVAPSVVFPDRAVFAQITAARPGVLVRCAGVLNSLALGREEDARGKF